MELKVAPQYREDLDCLLAVCGCQSAFIHQRQDRRYIKGRMSKTRRRHSDSHRCSDAGCSWTLLPSAAGSEGRSPGGPTVAAAT